MISAAFWIWLGVAIVLLVVAALVIAVGFALGARFQVPGDPLLALLLISVWPVVLGLVALDLLIDAIHFVITVAKKPH